MGKKAARRKRGETGKPGGGKPDAEQDPKARADAALARLVRSDQPGNLSLAGAYVWGYAGMAAAQLEGEEPDWFCDLDPLETLFLGTAWPQGFRDSYEFANSCAAWLRLLRSTAHWNGIERFAREALDASAEFGLAVDDAELMHVLAGLLEDAGLAQRKIPSRLLPGELLRGARCVVGPGPDIRLPQPPSDSAERIGRFWASVEAGLPGDGADAERSDVPDDGTVAEALAEGLRVLARAGLDIRSDPSLLLPALYLALTAEDGEALAESPERSEAWAYSLDEDSPLVPVTDVLITGPDRELSMDDTLGALFGIAAFTGQVHPADRAWRSSPGHALLDLAFELGYRRVVTRDGDAIRLDAATTEIFRSQFRLFEEKFGRPPGPEDPLFFDPEATEPRRLAPDGIRESTTSLLQAADVCPAWMYAHDRTDGLMPLFDGTFTSEEDRADWDAAIEEYIEAHPGTEVDHEAETAKLQMVLLMSTLHITAFDPQYAARLVARLSDETCSDDDTELVGVYLAAVGEALIRELRRSREVLDKACEYARAWEGAALAAQVRAVAESPAASIPATGPSAAVLLAAAVAAIPLQPPGTPD